MPRKDPIGSAQLTGELQAIASLQAEEEDALLTKANVVGVAVGNKIKDGKGRHVWRQPTATRCPASRRSRC